MPLQYYFLSYHFSAQMPTIIVVSGPCAASITTTSTLRFVSSAMNLLEVAKVLNLTTLVKYLDTSDLSATLGGEEGPFTLFAPSNKAFEDLPESVKRSLRNDPAKLKEVLSYHVIPERKWTYEFGKDNLVNSTNESKKLRLNSFRFGKVRFRRNCPLL